MTPSTSLSLLTYRLTYIKQDIKTVPVLNEEGKMENKTEALSPVDLASPRMSLQKRKKELVGGWDGNF